MPNRSPRKRGLFSALSACVLLLLATADLPAREAGPLTLPSRADAPAMLDTLSLCAVVCSFNFGSYADVIAESGSDELFQLVQAYYQLALVSTGAAAAVSEAVGEDRAALLEASYERGDARLTEALEPLQEGGGDEAFAEFQTWNEARIAECSGVLEDVGAADHLEALMALTGDMLPDVLPYMPDIYAYMRTFEDDSPEPGTELPESRD